MTDERLSAYIAKRFRNRAFRQARAAQDAMGDVCEKPEHIGIYALCAFEARRVLRRPAQRAFATRSTGQINATAATWTVHLARKNSRIIETIVRGSAWKPSEPLRDIAELRLQYPDARFRVWRHGEPSSQIGRERGMRKLELGGGMVTPDVRFSSK